MKAVLKVKKPKKDQKVVITMRVGEVEEFGAWVWKMLSNDNVDDFAPTIVHDVYWTLSESVGTSGGL